MGFSILGRPRSQSLPVAGLTAGARFRRVAGRYAVSALAVVLATAIKLLLASRPDQDSPFLLYFAAVVGSALYGGLGPGILAALGSAGAATFLFLRPDVVPGMDSPDVRLRLAVFLTETLVISGLCAALRTAKLRLEAARMALEVDRRERQLLLSDTDARRRAAEALSRVETLISQSLDPRAVQQQIVSSARELFSAPRTVLDMLGAESGGFTPTLEAYASAHMSPGDSTCSAGLGLSSLAAQDRRAIATADALHDPRVRLSPEERIQVERTDFRAVLVVPLVARGAVLGVLVISDRTGRMFSDDEQALAQTFAAQAANALEHAQLYEQAGQRAEKLITLSGLTRLMTSAAQNDEVVRSVAEGATRLLGAALSRVWINDPAAGVLHAHGTFGVDPLLEGALGDFPSIPHGKGLVGRIVVSQTPEYVPDIAADPRWLNQRLATEGGLQGFAGVPLIAGDRIVGVLAILFRGPRRFTAEERALIELLADAAAIAINTAQLLDEARAGRAHLAALLEINKTIGIVRSSDTLLNLIAEEAARLLGVDNAGFRLLEGDELVLAGRAGSARETMLRPRIRVGESMTGRVIAERRSLILDIAHVSDVVPEHSAADQRLGYSAFLGVPVQHGSRLLGVLAFRARRPFTPRDQALAEAFAGQAAIAIEHARLDRESRQQAERMKALADLGRALSETLAVEVVAQRVGQSIRTLLGTYSSALYRLDPDTGALVAVGVAEDVAAVLGAQIVFPRGTGVAGLAVAQRQPIATPNLLADARVTLPPDLRARIAQGPYRSVLAVPLRVHDRVIGALAVGDREDRVFTADEIALAQAFGDHAALVLENARLYQDVQRAYEDLSRTQNELVRAGTLKATGELAAGAAHHLNNLLQVALTRIQLFRRAASAPEVGQQLGPAEQALWDSAEVVRRLSAFSRAHPPHEPVPVDLNRVAADVVALTQGRWQNEAQLRGVRIDVRLEAGTIPCIAGDPAALREVLVNLVLNAVDAMPQGGQITIRTWATAADVCCAVSDTGMGMSREVQQRVLEPFFTTKGVKNTGLGLSVNYGIIQRHGGELTIDSTEGQGTTITVRFPLAAASEQSPDPVDPEVTPQRILLVDDDHLVRTAVAEVLASDGHTVTEAESGQDALAHVASGESIDLVLTDLGMPGMTGWEVARSIKASHRDIPVGLITGWGPNPTATPVERAAVDFVLSKPVTQQALRACLAHVRVAAQTGSRAHLERRR